MSTPWVVTLVGCPGKVLEGRAGTVGNSVPGHRSWRACKACCLNCCMGVAQTGHLAPSCPPCTGQSGRCSWSKRKVAKPGSCEDKEKNLKFGTKYYIYKYITLAPQYIFVSQQKERKHNLKKGVFHYQKRAG